MSHLARKPMSDRVVASLAAPVEPNDVEDHWQDVVNAKAEADLIVDLISRRPVWTMTPLTPVTLVRADGTTTRILPNGGVS